MLPLASLGLTLLDQGLKWFFVTSDSPLVRLNSGIAFGISSGWFSLIGLGLLVVVAYVTKGQPTSLWRALSFPILANFIDRLWYGAVVDYLHLGPLTFNISDVLICTLVARLIYLQLRTQK